MVGVCLLDEWPSGFESSPSSARAFDALKPSSVGDAMHVRRSPLPLKVDEKERDEQCDPPGPCAAV